MSVLDFAQGFGAVQLATSVPTDGAPAGAFFHENELASDDLHYYSIHVSEPDKNLTVTVAWFDPPSTVSSYNVSVVPKPNWGGGVCVFAAIGLWGPIPRAFSCVADSPGSPSPRVGTPTTS